jgi:hypothetical protein
MGVVREVFGEENGLACAAGGEINIHRLMPVPPVPICRGSAAEGCSLGASEDYQLLPLAPTDTLERGPQSVSIGLTLPSFVVVYPAREKRRSSMCGMSTSPSTRLAAPNPTWTGWCRSWSS